LDTIIFAMPLTFRAVPMDVEPAASLVGALREEMRVLSHDLDLDAPDMPRAGCASSGRHSRMAARDLGYVTARLDTGPRQPSAGRIFRDAGFFGEKAW
jgi:hypothetical protein